MRKKYLLILMIFILCSKASAQENNLRLYLENISYDSLSLRSEQKDILWGEKKAKFLWEFTVPDTIESFTFKSPLYQSVDTIHQINFLSINNEDTILFTYLTIDDIYSTIYAQYRYRKYVENVPTVVYKQGSPVRQNVTIVSDVFEVTNKDSSDIFIRTREAYFSFFSEPNNKRTYDDFLNDYIQLSKDYPDSKYLMVNLSKYLTRYKSREDVSHIYNNLSEKYKSSKWGKKIQRFLQPNFENISLPTLDQKTFAKVVEDSSKYNLIIFTASWCRPCIEEIPLLKQIYTNLKENLILTYISIDEQETINAFQKQMKEQDIPWRALLAYQDIKKIKAKYFIDGIPQGVLVYPNGTMQLIDVRDQGQREMLYSLCGK